MNGTIPETFSISSGVRQGCVLAGNLFNTATNRILNKTTQALTLGVNYDDSGQLTTDLDYADDVVIFADLLDTLKDVLFMFNEQSENGSYMSTGPRPSFSPSALGCLLHHQHSSEHNLSQRPTTSHTLAAPSPVITAVLTTSTAASPHLPCRSYHQYGLHLACPLRLYNSLIISIINYSSAPWTLTKAQKKGLDAFNTKALRRIVGVRWYAYITNNSILTRTGQPPLTTTICKLRLSAFGHMLSATWHPSHRHSGLHPTFIMVPHKRTPTTPLG